MRIQRARFDIDVDPFISGSRRLTIRVRMGDGIDATDATVTRFLEDSDIVPLFDRIFEDARQELKQILLKGVNDDQTAKAPPKGSGPGGREYGPREGKPPTTTGGEGAPAG